jgi:hypothetical protein
MASVSPSRRTLLALALSLVAIAPYPAHAHFVLRSPASWRVQDGLGGPQKLGPCGNEGAGGETGIVTAYAPGETITITFDETIYHPGHYRVALAVNDRSELPDPPPVSEGATPCGSVPIADAPAFPVLADGALVHTAPFPEPQSVRVTLPSDLTCARCTLQVLEFMSNHGLPCFYYHCADISIRAGAETSCTSDADCADDDGCTSDRCNPDTRRCESVDTSSCDDGDPCTRDTCTAAEGCVGQPIGLDDVTTGFLGALDLPPCASEQVPPAVTALFRKADTLVTRAAGTPAKAGRLLIRGRKRLQRAAKKVTKATGRRLSTECGTAMSAALAQAGGNVECLLRQTRQPVSAAQPDSP